MPSLHEQSHGLDFYPFKPEIQNKSGEFEGLKSSYASNTYLIPQFTV